MKTLHTTTTVSLIALAAAFAMSGSAEAGCVPAVTSTGGTTCIGTNALTNNTAFYATAIGQDALLANTTGTENLAAGDWALKANTTGSSNTAVGSTALQINTTGVSNTGIGHYALRNAQASNNTALGDRVLYNTTGSANTASGVQALTNNTTGGNNIALGYQAGFNHTTGSNNIVIGNVGVAAEAATIRLGTQGTQTRAFVAGISGVTISGGQAVVVKSDGQLGVAPAVPGTSNVALGSSALIANTTGNYNTAAGAGALSFNTSGANNTASGASALAANTTGSSNTASGNNALFSNTTGSANSASGVDAMRTNTTGSYNVSNGNGALKSNTVGSKNVAVGFEAARKQTTGSNNVAVGFRAGLNWTTGSFNVAIASAGVAGDTKTIRIGVQGTQKRAFLAGVRGVNITGGQAVVVNASGQLGVISSSRRYKQDIQPMGEASDPLLKLRPVTFHYKQAEADGSRPLQYGLIAEEVAATMPDLAIYNAEGQPESVAYQLLPSLLLNEYQKQAKELDAAREQLGSLEAEMAAMKLTLARLASAQSGKTQLASAP